MQMCQQRFNLVMVTADSGVLKRSLADVAATTSEPLAKRLATGEATANLAGAEKSEKEAVMCQARLEANLLVRTSGWLRD